jgi:hypothetical protein
MPYPWDTGRRITVVFQKILFFNYIKRVKTISQYKYDIRIQRTRFTNL